MQYKEFPDIAVPPFLESWDDTSWHNDAMASSTRHLEYAGWVVVWVAEDDPAMREFQGCKKYQATVWNEDRSELLATLMQTDDLVELEKLVSLIQYGEEQEPVAKYPATMQGLVLFAEWTRSQELKKLKEYNAKN